MALTFKQEILRTLQDALPFHKTLPLPHASYLTHGHLPSESLYTHLTVRLGLGERPCGRCSLAGDPAVVYTLVLERPLLAARRAMGKRRLAIQNGSASFASCF